MLFSYLNDQLIISLMKHLIFLLCLAAAHMATGQKKIDYDKKLKDLGIELIKPPAPIANYVEAVQTGKLLFLAGHGPSLSNGTNMTGKLGKDLTVEQGMEAARATAISLLSTLKDEVGDLNNVKRIVKVNGWVNCTDDFQDQPKVMNGCSDLLVAVFGDLGKHARTSLGTNALPLNIVVEIEMIVELK